MKNNLKRGHKIRVLTNDGSFSVIDNNGNIVFDSGQGFCIYLRSVNFKKGGMLEGKYLGLATDSLLDMHCKKVIYDLHSDFKVKDKVVKTGGMVYVNSVTKEVIIIT